VPKIISEHCELVNLCHINYSGPVFFFFRHSVLIKLAQAGLVKVYRI